jgi:hypothetical protein
VKPGGVVVDTVDAVDANEAQTPSHFPVDAVDAVDAVRVWSLVEMVYIWLGQPGSSIRRNLRH